MRKYYQSEQSGRSMVEMLGVLAIIGVLSVGGIAGYSKAMAKFKINQALDQITTMVINIRSTFSTQIDFSDASTANIIALGLPDANMISGAGAARTLVNPFGGNITIGHASVGGEAANSSFTIKYDGLDSNACQSLALADWGSAASSGLLHMKVGNQVYNQGDFPLTVSDAVTNCAAANDGNEITWEYR